MAFSPGDSSGGNADLNGPYRDLEELFKSFANYDQVPIHQDNIGGLNQPVPIFLTDDEFNDIVVSDKGESPNLFNFNSNVDLLIEDLPTLHLYSEQEQAPVPWMPNSLMATSTFESGQELALEPELTSLPLISPIEIDMPKPPSPSPPEPQPQPHSSKRSRSRAGEKSPKEKPHRVWKYQLDGNSKGIKHAKNAKSNRDGKKAERKEMISKISYQENRIASLTQEILSLRHQLEQEQEKVKQVLAILSLSSSNSDPVSNSVLRGSFNGRV